MNNLEFAHFYVTDDDHSSLKQALLSECAALFSNHYGTWSTLSPFHPTKQIKLSSSRLIAEFLSKSGQIITARDKSTNTLVAHACVAQYKIPDKGIVTWVTQLVVHAEYRHLGIATEFIRSLWFSDHYACGLCTSNPYTIRALESGTKRKCDLKYIQDNVHLLEQFAHEYIPYTKNAKIHIDTTPNHPRCVIDTKFFVNHETIPEKLKTLKTPWTLGSLQEGEEWLAFVFQDQPHD